MAHRASRTPPWLAGAARRGLFGPLAGATAAEAAELARLARRMAPRRRVVVLVGLALLALVAFGGMAGAATPRPPERSALQAFSSAAATSAGPVGGAFEAASAPAVEATPTALADDPAFQGPDLLDLGAKTVLVVALLLVTLRILRRVQGAGPARGGGQLTVLESRPLGPKTQLHLVAVGDRRLVIGQSPSGLVALGDLDAAELPATEPVSDPWTRRDVRDVDAELEVQLGHELATGRRARLGVSA
jgi:flagellar biogenesis protein FliO